MTAQNRAILKAYFETGDRPTQAQFANLIDSFPLISGDTMAGALILSGDPAVALGASTKQYVDNSLTAVVSAASALFAPIASPVFTGNPTAPTATVGDNDTSIATTAFVQAAAGFKVGTFTRDISLTTNLAITGVGFVPKALVVIGVISNNPNWSVGLGTVATNGCIYSNANGSTATQMGTNGFLFTVQTAVSDAMEASINSFDTDGFTLSFQKQGSPTGTITLYYLAMR